MKKYIVNLILILLVCFLIITRIMHNKVCVTAESNKIREISEKLGKLETQYTAYKLKHDNMLRDVSTTGAYLSSLKSSVAEKETELKILNGGKFPTYTLNIKMSVTKTGMFGEGMIQSEVFSMKVDKTTYYNCNGKISSFEFKKSVGEETFRGRVDLEIISKSIN